jgi:cyclopropane fatty-acyl-phospholipid synthase-like methyltransferase
MERFSQAADSNQNAILHVIRAWLPNGGDVLEIGSGSGQHAIHMAKSISALRWQPTEQAGVLAALTHNVRNYGTPNIAIPISLDLSKHEWPSRGFDAVYSANVLHIVNTTLGATLIQGSAAVLERGGFVLLYGPFKYRGKFTTESNANFDAFLRDRDSKSGIRDVEWVSAIAEEEGLKLIEDQDMPANNQFLIFRKLR